MDNLLTVAFEAHSQEGNHHRRYQITVGRDLFDDWTVAIRFGRADQGGREMRFASPNVEDARAVIRDRLRRRLTFLNTVAQEQVIVFDQPAAELAGRISGDLDRIGQIIGLADPMIAAVALHHGLELVTGNTAHFQRIQQLGYPLVLANWRV